MEVSAAYDAGRALMDRWGLKDWRLDFNQSFWHPAITWRLGRKARTIELSWRFVRANTPRAVEQIVLHEIAHALTVGLHNEAWREVARRIGCEYTTSEVPGLTLPPMPWTVACPACNVKFPRARRVKDGSTCKCGAVLICMPAKEVA